MVKLVYLSKEDWEHVSRSRSIREISVLTKNVRSFICDDTFSV